MTARAGPRPCDACGARITGAAGRAINLAPAAHLTHRLTCTARPVELPMNEPDTAQSLWDQISGQDFRRVPEGEKGAGSPLIIPIGGGEPVRYSRCTSWISAAEDDYGIAQWKRHLTVDGILNDDDLTHVWREAQSWAEKVDLSARAFDAAGGWEKANRGTRMHTLTDWADGGEGDPQITPSELADLDAYRAAVAPFDLVHAEVKVVHDDLGVAGTPDRVWSYRGRNYIGDLKTGKIDARKCAMQTALYARSRLYDVTTGQRTDLDVNLNRALIVHLPYGEARARVLWVDIDRGWDGVEVCAAVHAWRKTTGLSSAFVAPAAELDPLTVAIADAASTPDLDALWRQHRADWTDAHNVLAGVRKRQLAAQAAA